MNDAYTLFPDKKEIDLEKFRLIYQTFNQILIEYIIYSGHIVRLPRRLGTLSIRSSPPKKQGAADYGHFKRTREIIYYQNYATEGKLVTFHWDKDSPHCLHPTAKFFRFKPLRTSKSKLYKVVTELLTINKYFPKS